MMEGEQAFADVGLTSYLLSAKLKVILPQKPQKSTWEGIMRNLHNPLQRGRFKNCIINSWAMR